MQAVIGDAASWSDGEYLMAMVVDSVASLNWMFAGVHAKNPPRRPPEPVRRPGDISRVDGVVGTINLSEREVVTAGSFTFAELDDIIERQTGRRPQVVGMGG